jgi:hypothetical protein
MTIKGRLDRLEHLTVEPVAIPAEPPAQALELMLDELTCAHQHLPPEHLHALQVCALDILKADEASPEGKEMALHFLTGKHDA